jgi:iron complex transport system substrate-binding protein
MKKQPNQNRLLNISKLMSISLMLAILVIMTMASCQAAVQPTSAAATFATSSGTRTIQDCSGRTVTIPDHPRRIVCLYAATAHLLTLFNAQALIVGAPEGIRRDVLMTYKQPDIATVAVPFQDGSINIEELARIRADVALIRLSTAQNPAETEKLTKLGIPYVVVDFTSIAGLRQAVTVVGNLLDNPERAASFLKFYDDTLQMVSLRLQGLADADKPRIYHAVNEASRTDQAGDICSEITRLAGVINVSTDSQLSASEDKHYTWSPAVILANDPAAADYMLTDSKWQGLAAVRSKQVFVLPVGVSRWCHPGSIEPHMAVLFIARQFYPDRFADLDLVAYTQSYYQQFFALDLDRTMVIQILSGRGMRLPKE